MTQAKRDQDAVNEIVAGLAMRFGPNRILNALHTYANKRGMSLLPDANPFMELVGHLESLEHSIGHLEFPTE